MLAFDMLLKGFRAMLKLFLRVLGARFCIYPAQQTKYNLHTTTNFLIQWTVVMVAAQHTWLANRAVQHGKFQQFYSAVPRSVNEDETTSLH